VEIFCVKNANILINGTGFGGGEVYSTALSATDLDIKLTTC